ncbi:MAG: NADH-quinone oxidoreductase subunit H, partial [Alphaproteobacteria bacterium]
RDLLKLLKKRPVLAENASIISRAAPYVAVGAALLAAALVPSFARGMLLAPFADLLLIAGLLALGRFAMALAEPALVLAALIFAILAGTTNLDVIIGIFQEGALGLLVSLGFAAVALLAVAVAENARIPVDNPATHLELTMVHEAMILEASGRHLALWDFQASLRLTLWLALLAAVFLPFGMAAPGAGPVAWVLGLCVFIAKMAALAFALAVFESAIAKMRVFRVPEFLGAALLLGLLGAVFLFVSTGLS